eukprot:Gb_38555 [translate_table: standard]
MGGLFPMEDEGNGAFINVYCHVMPCPNQSNHHDMTLIVNYEDVELPVIGVDFLNGAQSPSTHNDNNKIPPTLVEKVESFEIFVQSVHEDDGLTKHQPWIILRSVECVPNQATAQNSYGLVQGLNGSEILSTKLGVPCVSSHMEEIMYMLDRVIPKDLCSVGCEDIMEETTRHNNIDHENHEQHTNTMQRTPIMDELTQFDQGAMPKIALLRSMNNYPRQQHPVDVFSLLSTIEFDIEDARDGGQHIHNDSREEYGRVPHHPTSFSSRTPNSLCDMEQIRIWLKNPRANTREGVDWPDIDSSPLNEYNTEGIFYMEFSTLFLTVSTSGNIEGHHMCMVSFGLMVLPIWMNCIRMILVRKIFEREARKDYEELVNRIEWHTRCNEGSYLCKKGRSLVCRYNAPWELQSESTLFIDENGQKNYEARQNDDRDVHNYKILLMWRGNMDCQPITSMVVILKYIGKYAEKAERRSESYHDMPMRVANIENPSDAAA